jgi:MarR family transcriptional regulator, organic hydroperoxide resistance regulator
MTIARQASLLSTLYAQIYFACHLRHVRDEETGRSLTVHKAAILDNLNEIEPTTLLELARHMGVTASTMSVNVNRLVGAGYVARTKDQHDRRRLALRLTKTGSRIKERNSVLDAKLVASMVRRLTPSELELGLAGLRLLARAASELAGLTRVPEDA